jgi:putative oxidoreductase
MRGQPPSGCPRLRDRPAWPFITALENKEKAMSAALAWIRSVNRLTAKLEWLATPLALATRIYVGWVFLKSGYLKISDWDSTLALFHDEYRVPLLPPDVAAVLGTGGELLFPLLLIPGLMGRLSAIGLSFVNVMAVISYAHVLLSEGFEAAIGQHYLWGFMLAVLVVYGPGVASLDYVIERRTKS